MIGINYGIGDKLSAFLLDTTTKAYINVVWEACVTKSRMIMVSGLLYIKNLILTQ